MSPEAGARPKPAPKPTPETAHYWEGANVGELRIQKCNSCGDYFFYPRLACPHCGSLDWAWVVASGRATLHTYMINHRPAPGFEEDSPYAIAIVQLEEGPRMMSNIVGVEITPENLVIDMPLVVAFEARGDQQVPVFAPAGAQ